MVSTIYSLFGFVHHVNIEIVANIDTSNSSTTLSSAALQTGVITTTGKQETTRRTSPSGSRRALCSSFRSSGHRHADPEVSRSPRRKQQRHQPYREMRSWPSADVRF
jgi:hypothetical protein